MAVNPMLSSGAASIDRSRASLDAAAHKVATAIPSADSAVDQGSVVGGLQARPDPASASDSVDQAEALVSVTLYARQVQAAAKVVETADATIGFLLDIQA